MVSSGNADAALQGEGHISARRGGHKSCLRDQRAMGRDMMNGRTTIRMVMAPQADFRE